MLDVGVVQTCVQHDDGEGEDIASIWRRHSMNSIGIPSRGGGHFWPAVRCIKL